MSCKICSSEIIDKGNELVCSGCGFIVSPITHANEELNIEPEEVNRTKDDAVFVDVRTIEENALVSIPGSLLIPLNELPSRLDELDKNDKIITYCHHGVRGLNAAKFLSQKGFKVKNLIGGIDLWSLTIDVSLPRYDNLINRNLI